LITPKIDLKKELKSLYFPSAREVALVDIPAFNFLMIDSRGDPNTSKDFQDAIEALYSVSYALKFALKKNAQTVDSDYVVMPLEGLWWNEDGGFDMERRDLWMWTIMIAQPPHATTEQVKTAMDAANKKKVLPALLKMRFENFREGKAAQIMHIGPFSTEGPNVAKVHDFISRHGYKIRGKHHEIYLSDFRKTAPEKLKTVIRQPLT
jgi:hypothetical protein